MLTFATCNWGPEWQWFVVIGAVYGSPFIVSILGFLCIRRFGSELAFLIGLATFVFGAFLLCNELFDWNQFGLRSSYHNNAVIYNLYGGGLLLLGGWEMWRVILYRMRTAIDHEVANETTE